MFEHDHKPVVEPEIHDRVLDPAGRLVLDQYLFGREPPVGELVSQVRFAFSLLDVVEGFIYGYSVEPAENLVTGIVAFPFFVSFHECGLCDVHGVLVIVYHPVSDVEHWLCVLFDYRLKCASVKFDPHYDFFIFCHKYMLHRGKLVKIFRRSHRVLPAVLVRGRSRGGNCAYNLQWRNRIQPRA
jgi:hypothetical protein